jgi:molybdopterin/thiamine biosynthesis adenylyltransferase
MTAREMNDEQLLRYSRQIMLPQIDVEGQRRLLGATALVVGAGGLGSPAAIYLAAAGVGHVIIADDDRVELTNLQRQILHGHGDLDRLKVESARDSLFAINPDVRVTPVAERLAGPRLAREVGRADVVLDASDNFATRFEVNDACLRAGRALVSGAAVRMEGQVSVFLPARADSPCYRCLYREGEDPEQTCTDNGVLAPLVGVIGSLQALEAIKVVLGLGEPLCGRLLLFDGMSLEWRVLQLHRDPRCPACARWRQATAAQ